MLVLDLCPITKRGSVFGKWFGCCWGGGGVADGCCVGCVGIEKNAIASIISAIHRSRKPITIIVRMAPMRINNPAVPNRPTLLFADRDLKDLLKKIAVIIANAKSTIRAMSTTRTYPMTKSGVITSCQGIC